MALAKFRLLALAFLKEKELYNVPSLEADVFQKIYPKEAWWYRVP